jgi:hypothetical protein
MATPPTTRTTITVVEIPVEGELRAEFAFMEDALDAVDDEDGELVIEAGVGVALSLLFPSLDVAAVVAEFVGVETGVVVAGIATAADVGVEAAVDAAAAGVETTIGAADVAAAGEAEATGVEATGVAEMATTELAA